MGNLDATDGRRALDVESTFPGSHGTRDIGQVPSGASHLYLTFRPAHDVGAPTPGEILTAVRKQYQFWPGADGLDAWDIDRLIELTAGLPEEEVRLEDLPEIDSVYWFDQ